MPQPAFPRWALVGFAVAFGLVVVGGAWMYRTQEKRHLAAAEDTLLAVGRLKSAAISGWRADRLADVASFAESPFFVEAISGFLADGTHEAPLLARFRSICKNYGYSTVKLVDPAGRVRLASEGSDVPLHDEEERAIQAVWTTRRPQMSDLHRTSAGAKVHIEVVAPVLAPGGDGAALIGALVLDLDAAHFLFPLVRAWPTPSASAETLLVERDGDDVVFLNDLRTVANAALQLRLPLTRTDVPAVMAVLGQTGVARGNDYRGVDVLSALFPITDSPWFMVAKVDATDVLGPWRQLAALILALVVALVALLTSLGGALWWRTRKEQYRSLAEAQTGLRAASERQAALLAAVPEIIMEVGQDKVYTWANQAGLDFFGDDVVGKQASSYFLGEQDTYENVEPLFRGDEAVVYVESWQRRRDGEKRLLGWWCRVLKGPDGAAIGAISSARDLTERERAEEQREKLEAQLRQSQKMEAVGRLAGGVAHDFNNLLTAIRGNAALALDLAPDEVLKQHLHDIEEAGRRASEVTAQLLAYSRRQVIEPRVLALNETVGAMGRMLSRLLGEDVQFETFLASDLWPVKVDPTQIEQVVMNLAVNARDAMPEGGRLTLETQNVVLDAAYADGHAHTLPGEYVALALTDTGCGLDAATQQHLFEPFFTTKEQGRGTGLGLATVYGIVKQSGGSIEVYSEPGRGSTFKVYLPRAEGTPEAVVPARAHADLPRGDETLLLVEDDPAVARIVQLLLAPQGYTLLTAASGEAALQVAASHDGPIHLLVTDVVMPGMNGPELARRLREVRPETPVLFVSGYTQNAIVHGGVLEPGLHFLGKPFTRRTLTVKVRAVLGGADGQQSGDA